ncbi:DUF3073 domain-containing protein [Psychromicrobium sp. YIM B11713]|uniref:DUF3073 domain-containing protein n=1 Tax=Psychromicrobium sp. YIM B11713 TaxID=3145233 RepID=UPI00374EFEFF
MGRGRQKAKATKQARDMKYYSPSTDYSALERELSHAPSSASKRYSDDSGEPDYSEYEDKFGDDEADNRKIG